jgi:hypothetical protein
MSETMLVRLDPESIEAIGEAVHEAVRQAIEGTQLTRSSAAVLVEIEDSAYDRLVEIIRRARRA